MTDDPRRPGPSEPPFRMTLHCVDGQARHFPLYADAAFDNVMDTLRRPDRPFTAAVLEGIHDRAILLGANLRLYTHVIQKGEGLFFFTDDDGREWGFPARSVLAIEAEDPKAKERTRSPVIGFRPAEGLEPGAEPPPLRVIEGGVPPASTNEGT